MTVLIQDGIGGMVAGLKVLIFGASSGIGVHLAATLASTGDVAVPVVRSPRAGAEQANVLDPAEVDAVFRKHPDATAVVSLVGGRPFRKEDTPADFEGNRNLIESAKRHGVKRFVMITTIGAGDSLAAAPWIAKLVLGRFMKLKTQAENLLRESGLAWTIVRPGHLKDGPPSGRAVLAADPKTQGAVLRTDVAELVAKALADAGSIGKTYSCVEPKA